MTEPSTPSPDVERVGQSERICARLSEHRDDMVAIANDVHLDRLTRHGATAAASAFAEAQRIVREETASKTGVTPVGRPATPEESAMWEQMTDAAREEQRP